jgi:hypothetical protein
MQVLRDRIKTKALRKSVEKVVGKFTEGEFVDLKRLSSGSYASVYELNKDLVVRIEDGGVDEGHNRWMEGFVLKNRSKYVPKVVYYAKDDYSTITVMEKLKEDMKKADDIMENGWVMGSVTKTSHKGINRTIERMIKAGLWPDDMHNENMMFRKDGTPVITDPIS